MRSGDMILVLGGAGYIGSHAVKILIENGESVVVVDNLETGHLASVNKNAIFHQVDIRNEEALAAVFEVHEIEAVMHFSANSLVGESCEDPLKYFENNVYGANVLLKVMRDHGVKKIIFSSTAAVYGEPKIVPITEDNETLPTNPYGESKLMMEKMFKWSDIAHGIKFVSLRYFNVAGADKSGDIGEAHTIETHLIPLVLQVPLGKRTAISIYGDDYPTKDGTCIRDYIHVIDLIQAHLLALNYLREGHESNIFNLGSGAGFSVKEVIEVAQEVTGKPIKTIMAPRRNGDPSVLIASPEKARVILKWEPKHTNVREIIEDAWRFHVNKPNGYQK